MPPSVSLMANHSHKTDIVAVGVKPTLPGYKPDDLGLLAISALIVYHIFVNNSSLFNTSIWARIFDHIFDHFHVWSRWRQEERAEPRAQFFGLKSTKKSRNHPKNVTLMVVVVEAASSSTVATFPQTIPFRHSQTHKIAL